MSHASALLLALVATASPALAAAQSAPAMIAKAVRFYRPDTKQTTVRAFLQIPYTLMDAGSNGQLAYDVTVKVADASGLTLRTDTWRNHAPAAAKSVGAEAVDMVEFAVAPGAYRLDFSVRDSVSGRQAAAGIPVEGYAADPEASDLLLASAMRIADAADTVPQAGEMRRGNTLITAPARLRLTPLRTKAYYLLEAYAPSTSAEQSGTMAVAVADSAGKTMLETPPAPVKIASGGGMLRGQLDLEGLPPGRYTMSVKVALDGRSFTRTSEFEMADLEATLERNVARISVERQSDEGFFKYLPIDSLDLAFAPLYYVARSNELKPWTKELSSDAKRRFLTQFWQRRDPDAKTPRNEARENFYRAVEYASQEYRERNVPGWKTDRGRVYAKYGAPDDVFRRQQEGRAPPYEVWRYTRGRARWFIFADRTGIGNYQLMQSNDLSEAQNPTWREVLTEDAVRDIGRYLGVDFYTGEAGPGT